MVSLFCLVWSGKAMSFSACLSVDIFKSWHLWSALAIWLVSASQIVMKNILNTKWSVFSLVCLVRSGETMSFRVHFSASIIKWCLQFAKSEGLLPSKVVILLAS